MDVLFVYGGNEGISPFISDQGDSLKELGLNISYFPIKGKGAWGYLKNIYPLKRHLDKNNYNLVHAHYGLSGLLANLQISVPVVTTFHGSDINIKSNQKFSKIASKLSEYSIFVSKDLKIALNVESNSTVIPCGVNTEIFHYSTYKHQVINILFASSFDRPEKNYPLAKEAVDMLKKKLNRKINLIELTGFKRKDVAKLINKADVVLLTSLMEGSPQIIKEAMACNCPCVATNVGDIKYLFGDLDGYYLSKFDPEHVMLKLYEAFKYRRTIKSTQGRTRISKLELDSRTIAKKILNIYERVLSK